MQNLLDDLTSGDDERAERAVASITETGADAISPLVELTRVPDVDSRWWAVRALAALPSVPAGCFFPPLADDAPEVRAAAALALCAHADESAIPVLINALSDSDSITAGLAMTALINIGKPAAPELINVLKNADGQTPLNARIFAARALGEIRDHRAIPDLMKSLEEDSALLQYWAQLALEKLGLDMVYMKP